MAKKFAYCTLVMRGDKYIPGALIMGYSLKLISSPDIDVIIMVTSDVSKNAQKLLSKIFDHVMVVPYIKYKSTFPIVKTKKQRERYNVWLSDSYTKWNIISMTQYEKVFLLDADTVAIKNIDDVFDFDTPAGVFDTPFSRSHGKSGFHDYYRDVKFGEKIPPKSIYTALNNKSNVAWGTAVLISPSKKDFKDFHKMLKTNQPFGFESTSGNDEQSITYFYYSKKKKWTNLPNNLNVIAWYSRIVKNPSKIPDFCDAGKIGGKKKRKTKKTKTKKTRKRKIKKEFIFTVGLNSPFLKKGKKIKRGGVETKLLDKCRLITCQVPHVIHFFGSEMVWEYDNPNTWPDTPIFWQFVYNMLSLGLPNDKKFTKSEITKLKKMYGLSKGKLKDIKETCFWCKFLKLDCNLHINYDHYVINPKNELKCPRIRECQ